MRWILIAAFFAPAAFGQTIGANVGASQLYGSAGVNLTFYFPQTTDTFSIGAADGRIVFGASSAFPFHGGILTIGDRIFGLGGVSIPVRGVSYQRESKDKRRRITLFSGAVGEAFSAPYVNALYANHFGAGGFYEMELFKRVKFSSLETLAGNRRSAVQSLAWDSNKWNLSGSGGVLQNAPFLSGQALFHPWTVASFSAAHYVQFYMGEKSVTDNVGASAHAGIFDAHASAFTGSSFNGLVRASGESLGAGIRLSLISVNANYFHSAVGGQVDVNVTEKPYRHFDLSQYFSRTPNGSLSVSWGGGFRSNIVTANVGYQTVFLPLTAGRSPFRQVLSINLRFQLPHSTNIGLSTFMAPNGKLEVGADGGSFFHGPLQGANMPQHPRHGGKYSINGVCIHRGAPLEGCAVRIGDTLVFSDSRGAFSLWVRKNRRYSLAVLPNEFPAPGQWIVVQAPTDAAPGSDVVIAVERGN